MATSVATRFWQRVDAQRVQCDICPRHCRRREGQRGLCYVRGCEQGIRSVAVTAGWICPEPRREFFAAMDAANVDLKAFTERFYRDICGGSLAEVVDTLLYLKHETEVWFEPTTLLIPGENDSTPELERLTRWVADELGADVPPHFTAFHPDWKLRDRPSTPASTPASTLSRARRIALDAGIQHAYTGNVHDAEGGSTRCPGCGERVIERDWYALGAWNLDAAAGCLSCGNIIAGVFEVEPGDSAFR